MSFRKYHTGRRMVTAALYSCGKESASSLRKPSDQSAERAIVADRIGNVIAGIAASPMLRDELIACGLSPELITEGLKYHAEFLTNAD